MNMEIVVTGQTIHNFYVTVTDELGNSKEFDIASGLLIDETQLDEEIDTAAATEHFWAQAALFVEYHADEVEKINYAQFTAHCEKYARYYLRGLGEKTNTDKAKDKVATLLFSKSATDKQRQEYIEIAYHGHKLEYDRIGISPWSQEEFESEMYSYPFFEDAEATVLAERYLAKQVRAIAQAFNNKSWTLKSKAATLRAAKEANL